VTIRAKDILHQGLKRFWLSGGLDNTSISITWANRLRETLAHLDHAHSPEDVLNDLGRLLQISAVPGSPQLYRMPIKKGWILQFRIEDPDSGAVTHIDIVQLPPGQH
jgi:hypothetical protein